MPLEKQVTSLAPSRKLRELGVKQESAFAWCQNPRPTEEWYLADQVWTDDHPHLQDKVAAYTVAELGAMLPDRVEGETAVLYLEAQKRLNTWYMRYQSTLAGDTDYLTEKGPTEAYARAKMLIYLIENGLVSVEEINNSL